MAIPALDPVSGAAPTRFRPMLRLRPSVTEPTSTLEGARRTRSLGADIWLSPVIDIVAVVVVLGPRLHTWTTVAFACSVALLLAAGSAERLRLRPTVGDDLPNIFRAVAIPMLLLGTWLGGGGPVSTLLRTSPLLLVALVIGRSTTHSIIGMLRRRGLLGEAAIILGAGEVGQRLAAALLADRSFGLRPLGFLEDSPFERLPLPVLGEVADLPSVLRRTGARRLIVAYGFARDSRMVSILRACDDARVSVYVLPRFFELGVLPRLPEIDEVRGMQLVRLRRAALRWSSRVMKRSFDVVLAGIGLLVSMPAWAMLALAVHLSGPGPVLFRQLRVGRDGREFNVLKFRTMREDESSDTQWGAAAEARITRVGAILRATSLDELPQLWNVLRGDMSIVGPRPERPHFVEIFGESIRGYSDRHRVAAGLTGWSQIHGLRGDTSIEDRAAFDNYYVENWSLWLDIRILVRTARAVLFHSFIDVAS